MTDVEPSGDDLVLADPATVLGQLQRGRGGGWLAAARGGDGRELLRSCLRRDLRWDSQIEERADYYARLVIALKLTGHDIDPNEVAADDDARSLGLSVLGRLAVRRDAAALQLLQLELERPVDRSSVLWNLADVPGGRGIEGVDDILVGVCDTTELADLINDTKHSLPWGTWAEKHPAIAAARSQAEGLSEAPRAGSVFPKADDPIDELLGFNWPGAVPKAVVSRLAETTDASDVRTLREAATGPWGSARRLASMALAQRRDPTAVDVAAEVFARNLVGAERASAYRYFLALDVAVILPLAREWLELEDDRSRVAATTMALHGRSEDLPAIRAAFARAWAGGSMYAICDLVDAFGRLPSDGPHPEVAVVFTDVAYSYARRRAAAALAATYPEFPITHAVECLWDCEAETRLIGASKVDYSSVDAKSGLMQLVDDLFEVEDVRNAAREAMESATASATDER
jgi:hypothetical protein